MDAILHGGIGLFDEDRSVRFYVNVDGRVWTCVIEGEALNQLAGIHATGEALFDQFMEHEDAIVARAADAIADGAPSEPVFLRAIA